MKCIDFKDSEKLLKNYRVIYDKKITYNEDGDVVSEYEYEYDDKGNVILWNWYYENIDISSHTENFYIGNKFVSISYDKYENITHIDSGNGTKEEYFYYDEYGDMTSKSKYELDDMWNMILLIDYDKDGDIIWKNEHEYELGL